MFLVLLNWANYICRCDEIGRRARLKIWCGSPHVPVRLWPPANFLFISEFYICYYFYFEYN